MKCLTCRWRDGEEGEMAPCYGSPPVMDGVYGTWPLVDEDARCPRYRRHWWKTLTAIYWRLRRWWYRRGDMEDE